MMKCWMTTDSEASAICKQVCAVSAVKEMVGAISFESSMMKASQKATFHKSWKT